MYSGKRLLLVSFLVLALCLSGCAAGQTPEPTATPSPPALLTLPGLVLSYPFHGSAEDGSGNGNHGEVHGAALTTDRFGIAESGYHFDGLDDDITFDAEPMPRGLADRTISAWVLIEGYPAEWMPGFGSRATVIGWGVDDWGQLCEMQIVDGRLCFHHYGPDETPGSATLELGRWQHLALAYGDRAVCLYVDGAQDKCAPCAIETLPGKGRIGAFPDPHADGFDHSYFQGIIDDIAVYDRALSRHEILTLYHEGGWGEWPRRAGAERAHAALPSLGVRPTGRDGPGLQSIRRHPAGKFFL